MTKKQVSINSGISVVSISKYEKGIVLPTVGSLYKLSKIYGFDYEKACDDLAKEKVSKKE